eukprot:scaffold9553_cov114-Isochrysis_galbana.AAC.21
MPVSNSLDASRVSATDSPYGDNSESRTTPRRRSQPATTPSSTSAMLRVQRRSRPVTVDVIRSVVGDGGEQYFG